MNETAIASVDIQIYRNMPYADAVTFQQEHIRKMRADSAISPLLLLVEHLPVITLGRSGHREHLLVSMDSLQERGIEFHETRRGGDITYHGPGQWTLYPLLPLDTFCRDLHRYMRMLEEMLIHYLAGHQLAAGRVEGKTGVWIGKKKIAAIGISVSNWISFHGAAINICPDMSVFQELIVPCGIRAEEGDVTSLAACVQKPLCMEQEKERLLDAFFDVFPFTRKESDC